MKRSLLVSLVIGLCAGSFAAAQTQKSLSSTMKIYVFPTEGQPAEQQSKDEAECYNWAVQNTGTDPFELRKQAEQRQQQAAQAKEQAKEQAKDVGKGEGAQGAVKGAATGTLLGEIASDDAGKAAAGGAAAGMSRGRRRGRQAQKQAEQQGEQRAQAAKQATEQQMSDFRKAFGVCLEAKDYMVKY